ncbi:MAG: M23 family peptidase [Alphaproteobacteria bacterium]|nr:M23 family peptidase [Alphaproteobacteria bacterium]
MASSQDGNSYSLRLKQQPAYINSLRGRQGARAGGWPKLHFGAVILPVIAFATFGQIASLDRITAHLPALLSLESRGPAYPATPVFSEILPPLTPSGKTSADAASIQFSTGAQTLTVTRGDTLQSLLTAGGVSWDQAQSAIAAIRKFFDPRDLRVGQQLSVILAPARPAGAGGEPAQLAGMSIKADVDRIVVARRQADGGFAGQEVIRQLTQTARFVSGKIESSLFDSALGAKVRPEVVVELIRLFTYDVDFQRDVRPGDSFDILYDRDMDENGQVARVGAIRYAALTIGNERKELFRFAPSGAREPEYFDQNGHTIRKALMKTPVDGAKITSRYGMRMNPILGYTRMHKGLDFGIAMGTPVVAAGDGQIRVAGWNGAYGKYIRIHHNEGYDTAYGHLSAFARGMRKGAPVRQGEIIGYSGSTGRSTGPHLHYEVLVNGAQVNPQSVSLPNARALTGRQLAQFKKLRDAIGQERDQLAQNQNQKPMKTAALQ